MAKAPKEIEEAPVEEVPTSVYRVFRPATEGSAEMVLPMRQSR